MTDLNTLSPLSAQNICNICEEMLKPEGSATLLAFRQKSFERFKWIPRLISPLGPHSKIVHAWMLWFDTRTGPLLIDYVECSEPAHLPPEGFLGWIKHYQPQNLPEFAACLAIYRHNYILADASEQHSLTKLRSFAQVASGSPDIDMLLQDSRGWLVWPEQDSDLVRLAQCLEPDHRRSLMSQLNRPLKVDRNLTLYGRTLDDIVAERGIFKDVVSSRKAYDIETACRMLVRG